MSGKVNSGQVNSGQDRPSQDRSCQDRSSQDMPSYDPTLFMEEKKTEISALKSSLKKCNSDVVDTQKHLENKNKIVREQEKLIKKLENKNCNLESTNRNLKSELNKLKIENKKLLKQKDTKSASKHFISTEEESKSLYQQNDSNQNIQTDSSCCNLQDLPREI